MKHITLPEHDRLWLARRFAVNRARFGGWRMEDDDDAATKAAAEKAATEKAAADKAAADKAAAEKGKESELGFPPDTPVREMTAEQAAAYHRHHARKHEDRNAELLKITGGKYGDDLKADLDELAELRKSKLTDGEKAVEEAKSTTRSDTAKEFGTDGARAALEIALAHDPENNDQSAVIDTLDLSKLLKDDGKVDTAKVRAVAEKFAPTDKGEGKTTTRDYGGGKRGDKSASGVAAGRARYEELHGKKSDKGSA